MHTLPEWSGGFDVLCLDGTEVGIKSLDEWQTCFHVINSEFECEYIKVLGGNPSEEAFLDVSGVGQLWWIVHPISDWFVVTLW